MSKTKIGIAMICVSLAGCATDGTPIVAGAVDQVGIAVSGGVQDQGANLTVGYRGAKFAVVPVQTSKGERLALDDGLNKKKGYSVFALLGIDKTAGGASPSIGPIEQVVAVGPAADIYAAGRAKLTLEQAKFLGLTQ
jgi:hypothetical protein